MTSELDLPRVPRVCHVPQPGPRPQLPAARYRPSGEKATSVAIAENLGDVNNASPDSTSQSFTVLSQLAEAIRRPSGEKATPRTHACVPLERLQDLTGLEVPELDRLVVAARDQRLAVGREGQGPHAHLAS